MSLKQLLTGAAANKAAIGQAIAKAYHAIPAPVYALAVPALAITGGLLVTDLLDNKDQIIEKLRDPDWKKKMVSYGAPAVGAALSTISGNPMPMIVGGFTAAVATLMEDD
jgi:Ni,Fe-hydrogenase III small subunit